MICHVAVTVLAHGCVVAEVVAVCAEICVRFGRFNAFLLLFQKEQSQGTSATTVRPLFVGIMFFIRNLQT